ncbi:MAG: hypothetical protein DMG78_17635, partial [Acidobacteria bacterium]
MVTVSQLWATAARLICLPSVLCPDWRTCQKASPAHSSRTSSIQSLLRWCQ